MANLSQLTLPVKDTITGQVTSQTFDLAGSDESNFIGTRAEWNALTAAQKAQYKTMDIKGEFNAQPIDSVPTQGSTNAVQSGGVYTAIQTATSEIEDPKVYISGVEETSTASQAYTIGSFLIYDGALYKVIASIALGDTLVEDTNIEATTVGSELTTMSNNLIASNNTAGVSNVPFRFGCDDDGNFGYIINEGGADTVVPFKSGLTKTFDIYATTRRPTSTDNAVVTLYVNNVLFQTATTGTSFNGGGSTTINMSIPIMTISGDQVKVTGGRNPSTDVFYVYLYVNDTLVASKSGGLNFSSGGTLTTTTVSITQTYS